MSIVALKKKYLESKNISHNKQFSLNSRRGLQYCKFNMGSLAQTSVKSSSYVHNRKKQWKSISVNYLPDNFDGDASAFKYICNNWVQTTGSDENYIENKALKAICDNSNNAATESNYCNISKKIDTEPSHVSKKIKTLECINTGYNRPFPYNVSASKPSFITSKDKPVSQIYNAYNYYGFTERYYGYNLIVDPSIYEPAPPAEDIYITPFVEGLENNDLFLFYNEDPSVRENIVNFDYRLSISDGSYLRAGRIYNFIARNYFPSISNEELGLPESSQQQDWRSSRGFNIILGRNYNEGHNSELYETVNNELLALAVNPIVSNNDTLVLDLSRVTSGAYVTYYRTSLYAPRIQYITFQIL